MEHAQRCSHYCVLYVDFPVLILILMEHAQRYRIFTNGEAVEYES